MRRASELLGLVSGCGLSVSLAATLVKAISEKTPVPIFFERITSGAWMADPMYSNIYLFAVAIYAFSILLLLSIALKIMKL